MANQQAVRTGKKIIHVVQHLAPGGLEILTLDLLRLAKPVDQVLIVSLEGTKKESIDNWPKLQPYGNQIVFMNKAPGIQVNIISQLITAFKAIRPDVVHTHHIGPLLYAGCAARISGVPTRIHTEHDAWHLQNSKRRRLQALALKAAKPTLVADATCVYKQLRSAFSYSNIITIKNGVDCDKFKPTSKSYARNMVVAFAGDGSKRKELQQLASRLNLTDRIVFLGLVEDMTTFYGALDTFCLPSRHEGLPLSTLEAQACNIPIVAMDVGAVDETLCPVSGTLVKKGSITGLAHALLEHQGERFLSPRPYILDNFDIIKMVASYDEISKGVYA